MGIVEKLKATLGRAPTKEEIESAKQKRDAAKRNGETLSHSAAAAAVTQEDWKCTNCGTLCFAQKTSCFKCGTGRDGSKPEDAAKHRRRDGIYKPKVAVCEDKVLTCQVCAVEFIFTAGEQDYFQRKGFMNSDRTRCVECTKAKKRKVDGGKPTCGGRLICFAWQKGTCSFGESCKFAHGEADGVLGEALRSSSTANPTQPSDAAAETPGLKCFHCGVAGHRVTDCPKAKAKAEKEREREARRAAQQPKKKKKRNRNGTLPTANKLA